MKMDPDSIAGVITAFSEIPARVAAMERALAELTAKIEALLAASPPLLVTVQEAATIWRVSSQTMRRWVATGHVPSIRRGRLVRVDMTKVRGIDAEDIARLAREARGLG